MGTFTNKMKVSPAFVMTMALTYKKAWFYDEPSYQHALIVDCIKHGRVTARTNCQLIFADVTSRNSRESVTGVALDGEMIVITPSEPTQKIKTYRVPNVDTCIVSAVAERHLVTLAEGNGRIRILNQNDRIFETAVTDVLGSHCAATTMILAGGSNKLITGCLDGRIRVYQLPWKVVNLRSPVCGIWHMNTTEEIPLPKKMTEVYHMRRVDDRLLMVGYDSVGVMNLADFSWEIVVGGLVGFKDANLYGDTLEICTGVSSKRYSDNFQYFILRKREEELRHDM